MFFKTIVDGYILAIGKGTGGVEIAEEEYNTILNLVRNKPPKAGTTDYRLREDLTWEVYEMPPPSEDAEAYDVIDKAEAFDILMGVTP